jgi:putative SOS response-associated peptidase YedK
MSGSGRRLPGMAKIDAETKKPFAIALKSGEPYGFAGLWETLAR